MPGALQSFTEQWGVSASGLTDILEQRFGADQARRLMTRLRVAARFYDCGLDLPARARRARTLSVKPS